ncbi:MAG TPA: lanthionine synthetase LanC family protein [Candidatus Limnocylindrales bacterium]|nr:lanthionine synthetase LanC family protein [Candidatus Limnocylindrales bacterium]
MSEAFVATAGRIGALLVREAIWDASATRATWFGSAVDAYRGEYIALHRTSGPDLYRGTAGIALFLARLYRETGERAFAVTALGALAQSLAQVHRIDDDLRIGFYSGYAGIAYAAMTVGELCERDDLRARGIALLLEHADVDPAGRRGLDVMSGIAGVIPLLIAAHLAGVPSALAAATSLGRKLVRNARRSERGFSWNTLKSPADGDPDLTGFSHGAGGIAWALLELHAVTGDQEALHAATEGFRYEQSWFSAAHGNWADLRGAGPALGGEGALRYANAWCHGAPGIALSRLRAYALTGEDAYREQAMIALRTASASLDDPTVNYSLCHGAGGNVEPFLLAERILGEVRYGDVARATGERGVAFYDRSDGWPGGVAGGDTPPDLFLGWAGIGYAYLRLHDSLAVPSVVVLEPERLFSRAFPATSRKEERCPT